MPLAGVGRLEAFCGAPQGPALRTFSLCMARPVGSSAEAGAPAAGPGTAVGCGVFSSTNTLTRWLCRGWWAPWAAVDSVPGPPTWTGPTRCRGTAPSDEPGAVRQRRVKTGADRTAQTGYSDQRETQGSLIGAPRRGQNGNQMMGTRTAESESESPKYYRL